MNRVELQSRASVYYGLGSTSKVSTEKALRNDSGSTSQSVNSTGGLTEEELNLAKEYKDYVDYTNMLKEAFERGYHTDEERAIIDQRKASGQTKFSSNVVAAMGIIELDKDTRVPVSVSANVRRFQEHVERPTFNIPRGQVEVYKDTNSIDFARGGKIYISMGYIYIADNHVSAFMHDQDFKDGLTVENWQLDFTSEGYAGIVSSLIDASEKNNSRFTKANTEKTLKFLDEVMGVDITKDININGTTFEVVDGQLQTKGYVYSKEDVTPDGIKYLRSLLEKAYEQNLI